MQYEFRYAHLISNATLNDGLQDKTEMKLVNYHMHTQAFHMHIHYSKQNDSRSMVKITFPSEEKDFRMGQKHKIKQ